MPTIEHDELVPEDIHVSYRFVFIDAADREVATGFTASQIGLFALQQDDRSIWQLIQITPVIKWKRISLEIETRTIADMDIYVDTVTGNDTTGDGSQTYPYQTIAHAASTIPREIWHKVNLFIPAGTNTECFSSLVHEIYGDGQFTIQGQGNPTVSAGPFTVASYTNVVVGATPVAHDIAVSGASWTNDEFVGKFLRPTSGSQSGKYYAIHENSSNTITIGETSYALSATDTFEIVDLPAKISVAHGISLNVIQAIDTGTLFTNGVRFGITGIYFEVTGSDNRFRLSGNYDFLHTNGVKIKASKTVAEGNTFIGGAALAFPDEIVNTDLRLPSTDYLPATIITDTEGAPGAYRRAFDICYGKCNMADVTVLGTIYVGFDSVIETYGCTSSGIETYNGSNSTVNNHYLGRCFTNGITSVECGGIFNNIYIRDTTNSVLFFRRSNHYCLNVAGITGNIVEYGLEIDSLSSVRINSSLVSGTLGDIRFNVPGTTVAYPTTGNSVTDSAGSFVVNK